MRVAVDMSQMDALNDLRGLSRGAHMLVMTSRLTATGGTLEGSVEDFDELVSCIGEELSAGMLRRGAASALFKLCVTIDPESASWLGM